MEGIDVSDDEWEMRESTTIDDLKNRAYVKKTAGY